MGKHGIGGGHSHGHSHSHINNHSHVGAFSNHHHGVMGGHSAFGHSAFGHTTPFSTFGQHHHTRSTGFSRGFRHYNNPFQSELNSIPQSDANTHIIRYNPLIRGYDASAYDPSFSDQNVSKAEVDAFVGELNSISGVAVSSCSCYTWLPPIIMLLCFGGIFGATIGILMNLEELAVVTDPKTGSLSYQKKGIPVTTVIILVVIIDACLIACMIVSSMCFSRCAAKRLTGRRDALMKVVDKYQPQFNAKNITIRMPPLGAYIALAKTGMPGVTASPETQMLLGNPALGGLGAGGQGMIPLATPALPPGFANPSNPYPPAFQDQPPGFS